MSPPTREYSTEELKAKLDDPGERFVLVDTLPHPSYEARHLPGAISLPLELLEDLAKETILDPDVELVTYCSGPG